jgi:predicted ATP-grasp superfamily ATP-dependent carboligase
MSVFLTDGEERATLAVVRALGKAGIPVTVGSTSTNSLAGSSRFCRKRVSYPSPLKDIAGFEAALLREMESGDYNVIFPITDISTVLVAQMRSALEPFVRVPLSQEAQIRLVQDKREMLLAAQRIGIPCPKSAMLRPEESLDAVAATLNYPVVLKPRLSWLQRDGKWASGCVQYANDAADLKRKYAQSQLCITQPLVQERIEGEGRGVFLLVWGSELKAAFCHRRLREKPPWGGVSVYCESVPLDRELVDKSYRLLQTFNWQGPAMVEFKMDNRDGQLKLMEVNGRFWGSLQLAVDSGMNFPLLYYRLAAGQDAPSQFSYRVGVRSRWLLGDLDQLLIQWTHRNSENGFPPPGTSRMRASLEFMKFYTPNLHYQTLRFDDPAPAWHELIRYVKAIVNRSRSDKGKASAH